MHTHAHAPMGNIVIRLQALVCVRLKMIPDDSPSRPGHALDLRSA